MLLPCQQPAGLPAGSPPSRRSRHLLDHAARGGALPALRGRGQLVCISQRVCCTDGTALLQYEPTIEELRHKYEAAMKEKMLVKLEKDRLAARSEALQAQVRCTLGRAVGGRQRVVSATCGVHGGSCIITHNCLRPPLCLPEGSGGRTCHLRGAAPAPCVSTRALAVRCA